MILRQISLYAAVIAASLAVTVAAPAGQDGSSETPNADRHAERIFVIWVRI